MKSRLLFKIALEISGTVLMVIAALLIGAILVVMSENSPAEAYRAMILGAFGSKQKITEVVVKLIPILIMASGVSVAFRAQLWNIGAGGQFLIGSIVSVAIALYLPVPLWLRRATCSPSGPAGRVATSSRTRQGARGAPSESGSGRWTMR